MPADENFLTQARKAEDWTDYSSEVILATEDGKPHITMVERSKWLDSKVLPLGECFASIQSISDFWCKPGCSKAIDQPASCGQSRITFRNQSTLACSRETSLNSRRDSRH